MFEVEATKIVMAEGWDNQSMTINELFRWMQENNIPYDAVLRYAGCGSHAVEFAWEARNNGERQSILAERERIRVEEEAKLDALRATGVIA